MFKKIALTLFLMMAGSVTASAQELQYIGVQGSWWNPNFAGEGFAIEEYGDGFVIAYWYTYDLDGKQLWLIGTGEKQGNTVELEMYRTEGGSLADPNNSETVTEELWGRMTLDVEDCGHINMSYQSVEGDLSGGYQILRLRNNPLAAGSCNAIELGEGPDDPPPPDDETPPPDDDPVVTVEVKLEKMLPGNIWVDVNNPFTGLAVIHKSVSGSIPRIILFRLRLTAVDGDVVIESFSAEEPTGVSFPSFEGLYPGMVIEQGSDAVFTLESNTTGGLRVFPKYNLFLRDNGELINLTVRLSTETL